MTRKDTRTKAERQSDKEWAADQIAHYLPHGSNVWAIRVNRTRSGRESWEFLAPYEGEIIKVSLFFARLFDLRMDQVYGGVTDSEPELTNHVARKLYGSGRALNLFKL